MEKLTDKKCVPCEGGIQPFTEAQITEYLAQLNPSNTSGPSEWEACPVEPRSGLYGVVDGKGMKIKRHFKFKDFTEAIAFVNKVAQIAEQEGHHPDITINYNKVTIELWTHSIGGLSENDFILASKIELLV